MSKPETCVCCGRVIPEGSQYCVICGNKIKGKQTNYDRIRNMSVEELANFLQQNHFNSWFQDEIVKYLESEVDT